MSYLHFMHKGFLYTTNQATIKGMTKHQQDKETCQKLTQMTHNIVSDRSINFSSHLLTTLDSLAISVLIGMNQHVLVQSDMHVIIAGSRRRAAPMVVCPFYLHCSF
jgi:hypothetical protein